MLAIFSTRCHSRTLKSTLLIATNDQPRQKLCFEAQTVLAVSGNWLRSKSHSDVELQAPRLSLWFINDKLSWLAHSVSPPFTDS